MCTHSCVNTAIHIAEIARNEVINVRTPASSAASATQPARADGRRLVKVAACRTGRPGLGDRELSGSAAYGARELRGVPGANPVWRWTHRAFSRQLATSCELARERGSAVAAPESSQTGRRSPALKRRTLRGGAGARAARARSHVLWQLVLLKPRGGGRKTRRGVGRGVRWALNLKGIYTKIIGYTAASRWWTWG